MKKGEIRDFQLAQLIAEELGFILDSAHDAELSQLSVAGVEPGGGAGHYVIRIRPSAGGRAWSPREIKTVLDRAGGYLKSQLVLSLNLKRAPQVTFMPDPLYSPFLASVPTLDDTTQEANVSVVPEGDGERLDQEDD
jgi:ribosome-binding factor A